MTNPTGNSMDAVANLLLERQRYEQWISSLDAKRAITPPSVFERVRADYERRLKEVIAQISGRTADVQSMIAALTEKLGRLQTDETALRDERYEAELRSAVGEYTPDQWKEVVKASDDKIARVAAERAGVSADLARLHQVLSLAGTTGSAPGTATTILAPASGTPSASSPPGVAPTKKPGFDELEFLQSVVGKEKTTEHAALAPAAPEGTPSSVPVAPVAPVAAPIVESAGASSLVSKPTPGTPTSVRPQGFTTGSNLPGTTPEKIAEEAQRASQESGAVPSYLKDVPKEQVKTLKCLACGTMNLPSEWYCESCGGELAAL